MLAKDKRLNLKKNFKWVVAGKKLETPNFRFFFRFSSNKQPLVGIASSKVFFKKAHLRNRARRLSSEAAQFIYSDLPSGLNLVIMPKSAILETSVDNLKVEIVNAKNNFKSD